MINECFALMGPIGWLMPLSSMLLLSLGAAALVKYLFTSGSRREKTRMVHIHTFSDDR